MTVPIIQAEFEELEQISRQFDELAAINLAMCQRVTTTFDNLVPNGWEGSAASAFHNEMESDIVPTLQRLVESLATAAEVTRLIVSVLESAEEEAYGQFRVLEDAASSSQSKSLDSAGHGGNFSNWLNDLFAPNSFLVDSSRDLLDIIATASNNRGATLELFRVLGRLLNDLTGQRGYVGAAEDLYRSLIVKGIPYRGNIASLLKSPLFKNGFAIVGTTLDIFSDIESGEYGGDITKIMGVNAIHGLGEYALATNPYGAAALLINAGVQLGGRVDLALAEQIHNLVGDPEMRRLLDDGVNRSRDALERMDLRNVTKGLAETIYHQSTLDEMVEISRATLTGFQQFADSDRSLSSLVSALGTVQTQIEQEISPFDFIVDREALSALGDTGMATVNLVDGLIDYRVSRKVLALNQGIALIDTVASSNPFLSVELKSFVHNTAVDVMNSNADFSSGIINLSDKIGVAVEDSVDWFSSLW